MKEEAKELAEANSKKYNKTKAALDAAEKDIEERKIREKQIIEDGQQNI